MSTFDILIATGFSVLVFALGLSFSKSGSNLKSFFAAGGAVPWWISGLSLFMSFFSVGTFVVWGSIAYGAGLVAVTIQTTMSIAGFIVGFYIAPKWNRARVLTAAEFVSERLGADTQKFYSIIFLLISLFSAGAFLYPVGKIIEVTTGIPLFHAIIALGFLIILYTAVGGLWAVLVTDVLQFVVLSAAVIIVVPLAFEYVGGISAFINNAPEGFFSLTNSEYDWLFMAAFGFYNMVFIGGSWAYVQRYTSVKTAKDAKKVGWLFGSLYIVAPFIWMLPPMIFRVAQPGLSKVESEGAYLMLSQQVVPDGLMGLIIGAMIFATASSVNTTLNISASVFTNDIYKFFRREHTEKETMFVARLSTLAFGILAVCIALMVQSMGGIVEVAFSLAAITGTALFLPPLWALFSRNQTGRSVVAVTLLSLLVNGFCKFVLPSAFDMKLDRSPEMLIGVLVPLSLLLAVEIKALLFKKANPQYLAYEDTQAKKGETKPSSVSEDQQNKYGNRIISLGILSVGLIITGLGLTASHSNSIVSLVGVTIFVIACVILYKSRAVNTNNNNS